MSGSADLAVAMADALPGSDRRNDLTLRAVSDDDPVRRPNIKRHNMKEVGAACVLDPTALRRQPKGMTVDPAGLLVDLQRLALRARAERQRGWLPVLLFGLLGLLLAPLYGLRPPRLQDGAAMEGLRYQLLDIGGGAYPGLVAVAWLGGIPVVCLLTAFYYRSRTRRVGFAGRFGPFLLVALALDAGLVLIGWLQAPLLAHLNLGLRGLLAYWVIAVGLLVLARLERDTALAWVALALLALSAVLNRYDVWAWLVKRGLPYDNWWFGLLAPLLLALYLTASGLVLRARATAR